MKAVNVTILSLTIRPVVSSELCFGVTGVIEEQLAQVGDWVERFDFKTKVESNLSPEMFSAEIRNLYKFHALSQLRLDVAASSLDQVVSQRTVSYLTLFKHAQQLQDAYSVVYGISDNSRLGRISALERFEDLRSASVNAAYSSDWANAQGIQGVVTEANTSTIRSSGVQRLNVFNSGQASISFSDNGNIRGFTAAGLYKGGLDGDPTKDSNWQITTTQIPDSEAFGSFVQSQITDWFPTQNVTTKFADLRNYSIENNIKNHSTQIGLDDQRISATLPTLVTPDLKSILDLQFDIINREVTRAQLQFANLYLTSPISGWVTAIFKGPGEVVATGEPVLRIENPDEIFLIGLVKCRSLLSINDKVKIVVRELLEEDGRAELSGVIVAVRGHNSINDDWELTIRASNKDIVIQMKDGSAKKFGFPMNYHLSHDKTEMYIIASPNESMLERDDASE